MRQMQPGEERIKRDYEAGDEFKYYYDKGNALAEAGQLQQAVAAYKRSVELNPRFAWSYGNMAIVLYQLYRFDEAEEAIDAALGLDPQDTDFANTQAAIREAMQADSIPTMSRDEITIALFAALDRFNGALALRLVESGADVNARDIQGNTPLHRFFRCPDIGTSEKLAKALVARGADVNARNDVGDTPWLKLQGISNQHYKRALSVVLTRLGASEDEEGLARKKRRISRTLGGLF